MSTFPDNLGIIGMGDGKAVFPGPSIPTGENLLIRDYEDRTFTFGLVSGLVDDPDLGYQFVQAAAYRIEITPHLGHPNLEDMFIPYAGGEVGNGRLKVFEIDVSDLTINDGETASYDIPLDDMKAILAPGYDRYLWRVMAVSEAGHAGHSSGIQTFRGRVVVPLVDWTLEQPKSPITSPVIRLRGTRTTSVAAITVNDSSLNTSYPSPTTWEADVPASPGTNRIYVRAFDIQGNGSEYRQVEVEMKNESLTERSYFNRFDDFGYMTGVERLPSERNFNFRARILDVFIHPANTRYQGLMNGIGRELDLYTYDRGLRIRPVTNTESYEPRQGVSLWLSSNGLYVTHPLMREQHEYMEIEGNAWTATPTQTYVTTIRSVQQPMGHDIDKKDWHYDEDDHKIHFKTPKYLGEPIYVTYSYATRVSLTGKTVSEAATELEAITIQGNQIITVEVDPELDSSARAEGLHRFARTQLDSATYQAANGNYYPYFPVRWSPFEMYAFLDSEFRKKYLNVHNSLFGTAYAGWAWQIKRELHTTWGFLVADQNVWAHPDLRVSGIGELPTTWDAPLGYWETSTSGTRYTTREAWPRDFQDARDLSSLQRVGVRRIWLNSGIGFGHDLYALVDGMGTSYEESAASREILELLTGTPGGLDVGLGTVSVVSSSEVSSGG